MIKKLAVITALCALFASPTNAAIDAIVGFSGSESPSGKFYIPFYADTDFMFGFSSTVPATRSKELDLSFLLGFNTPLPVLGSTDLYFTFQKYNDSTDDGTEKGTELRLQTFSVGKNWLVKLNDQVKLGLGATIAEVDMQGGKVITILPTISPVLGMEIKF